MEPSFPPVTLPTMTKGWPLQFRAPVIIFPSKDAGMLRRPSRWR